MAPSAARPAPGASPSWVGHGAGAASITAESPTRKGHPARRRLRAAGRAQPSHHGAWKVGDPSAAGSVLPGTHGARHPIPTLNWREQQPSQFKRLEDLHEDGRVPNVHIVSCRFRLPMPCLQKENGFVDAGLDSGR